MFGTLVSTGSIKTAQLHEKLSKRFSSTKFGFNKKVELRARFTILVDLLKGCPTNSNLVELEKLSITATGYTTVRSSLLPHDTPDHRCPRLAAALPPRAPRWARPPPTHPSNHTSLRTRMGGRPLPCPPAGHACATSRLSVPSPPATLVPTGRMTWLPEPHRGGRSLSPMEEKEDCAQLLEPCAPPRLARPSWLARLCPPPWPSSAHLGARM